MKKKGCRIIQDITENENHKIICGTETWLSSKIQKEGLNKICLYQPPENLVSVEQAMSGKFEPQSINFLFKNL